MNKAQNWSRAYLHGTKLSITAVTSAHQDMSLLQELDDTKQITTAQLIVRGCKLHAEMYVKKWD